MKKASGPAVELPVDEVTNTCRGNEHQGTAETIINCCQCLQSNVKQMKLTSIAAEKPSFKARS
jgi:hypothetical protein